MPVRDGEGDGVLAAFTDADHPVVRVAVPVQLGRGADDGEQLPPLWLQGVGGDFGADFDGAQLSERVVVEVQPVLAEAVDAVAGEDEGAPAGGVFDFAVAAPYGPITVSEGRSIRAGFGLTFYSVVLSRTMRKACMLPLGPFFCVPVLSSPVFPHPMRLF